EPLSHFINSLGKSVLVRINAFHNYGVYGEAQNWYSAKEDDVKQLKEKLIDRGITSIKNSLIDLSNK
ncbi:hypothetical protein ACKX1V_19225, partial [Acinetobacter baumannii]